MRILIYGLNFSPEPTSTGKYTGEMAEWLSSRGHDVIVITSPPHYPFWKVQKPYNSFFYKREEFKGMTITRCPLWVPRNPSGFKRILHLLTFAYSSFPVFIGYLFWTPDVVMAIEPTFFTAVVVALAKPFFRFKSWLHVQDFELEAAFSLGLLKGRAFLRLIRWMEGWVMNSFDRVSTISNKMLGRLLKKGVNPTQSVLLLNWCDVFTFTRSHPHREEWNLPESAKIVLYAGNLGKKQGLEGLLELAGRLSETRPDILFLIVGEGATKDYLRRTALENNLYNVRFLPLQPIHKFPDLLASADVHVIFQRRGASDLVMPSKLGNILAVGGAVLVTADAGTELYHLIHDNELGVVVEPESLTAVEMGLLTLLDDNQKRADYGKKAKLFAAQNLSKETILHQLEQGLLDLLAH